MQRKPSGSGGGRAPMNMAPTTAPTAMGAAATQRRPMLQSPYALHQQLPSHTPNTQQQPQQQQQQPQAYGTTMGMSMGHLGMNMTMSNMDHSLRSFAPSTHPQQLPLNAESTGAPLWRPTALFDPHQQQHQQHQQQQQQQYKPMNPAGIGNSGGLDLEFNDFLGGTGRDNTGLNLGGHAGGGGGGDMHMNDVSASFQGPTSFSSLASLSAPSSVAPLNMNHATQLQGGQRHAGGPSSSASTSPTSDASSTRSASTSGAMGGSSMARPAAPVVAATGATVTDGSDYSRFVDSTDEPDLSQQKIEQKNEKCQYHNCPNRARVSQAYGKFCNRHVIVAPCGFPGCRDKALIHCSMCDKHLAEGKDSLHRILANRAQNVPVCRTFGCFKNDQGRGYCRGHEKLLMATGRLPKHINKRRLNSAYTMCSYPTCNKHSQRNHLCRTHGNVILKQAEEIAKQSTSGESFEDALARLQKEIRRCSHPTCTKNSQRDRLCTMHYYEKHNLTREGATPREGDSGHLSSTDGGGESDSENPVCSIEGCSLQPHSGRNHCKYHSGQITPGGAANTTSARHQDGSTQDSDSARNHPMCSITGCGNVAPYASGLCQHHGNKTNQAIQITRMNPHNVAGGEASSVTTCSVALCGVAALPGNAVCEHHLNQRHFGSKADAGAARPNLAEAANYQNQGGAQFMNPTAVGIDLNAAYATTLERFNSGGATGRMASLSVNGGLSSSSAESDARQALVTLNGVSKQHPGGSNNNDFRSGYPNMGPTTCTNPICSRESYGREFCDSCQNIFSPLVVSVGDNNNASPYQFPSLAVNNQPMQPEPEGDTLWDGTSQAKSTGAKSRDLCRVKDCANMVTRAGLCDDHFRLFQAGSLSVDELTLRSRQLREERERLTAEAAAVAAAEMKQISSPKIKKYFCKMDGCDKQAQKRGLCKRHFRMQDNNSLSNKSPPSGPTAFGEHIDQTMTYQTQSCRFPGCLENVNGPTTLCPSHCKATFCWQAGCENLVESPQFCEYHAFRRECAYEGCAFAANRDSSGCINHAMERRCSHEHCEQFAGHRSDRCRLHGDDCSQQPCILCGIHSFRERGVFHAQNNAYADVAKHGGNNMGIFHSSSGNNDFVDERELTRDSVFGDGRLT